MAGSQLSKSVASTYLTKLSYRYKAITIDEEDTTAEPEIQAGFVEVNGDVYEFSTAESISGWSGIANSTQAYIYIVPSGSSCTAQFSDTAPTFSTLKQGHYNGNNRALWGVYKGSAGTTYENKAAFPDERLLRCFGDAYVSNDLTVKNDLNVLNDAVITGTETATGGIDPGGGGTYFKAEKVEIGYWNTYATGGGSGVATKTVAHGITDGSKILNVTAKIRPDAFTDYRPIETNGTSGPGIRSGCVVSWDGTNVYLEITVGGFFDSTDYNDAGINRGQLTIWLYV